MKTVSELNATGTGWVKALGQKGRQPTQFRLGGELGFRTQRCIHRLESELPYSSEYILSQITGARNQWSNFRKFHGDVAGRWILAMTFAYSGAGVPPAHLRVIVDEVLKLQNPYGTFGCVQQADEPLNMHKAYGNGWLLKGLTMFAQTFGDERARAAVIKLGDWYLDSFSVWTAEAKAESDTGGNYAVSRSCYFHALDGLVSLYRLTGDTKILNLAGAFIPHLTPQQEADHTHMYLTCRRGVLEYYIEKNDQVNIAKLADELRCFADTFVLETGGTPERMEQNEAKRKNPDRLFTDEACTNFDWLILCLRLHETTGVSRWRDLALLNLENQIFYNQQDNGGFGDSEFGPYYPRFQKEAPWCCSLFGPFGLLSAAAMLIRRAKDSVVIHAPLTGTFVFADGTSLNLERNDEQKVLSVNIKPGTEIRRLELDMPFWMKIEKTRFEINGPLHLEIPFEYRLWFTDPLRVPAQQKTFTEETQKILFYGPWVLAHRFHDPLATVFVKPDPDGLIQRLEADFIRGLGPYGESVRVRMPSDVKTDPNDVALDPRQHSGELYLYPLKDKEVVWRAWTRVNMKGMS